MRTSLESDTDLEPSTAVTAPETTTAPEQEHGHVQEEQSADTYPVPATFGGFLWEVLVGGPTSEPSTSPEQTLQQTPDREHVPEQEQLSPQEQIPVQEKLDVVGALTSYLSTTLTSALSGLSESTGSPLNSPRSNATSDAVFTSPLSHQSPLMDSLAAYNPLHVKLVGRSDTNQRPVMTEALATQLLKHLPRRYRDCANWKLVFANEQHGTSIKTFYRNVQAYCDADWVGIQTNCPSILCILDQDGAVFGAFVTECWRATSGTGSARESTLVLSSSAGSSASRFGEGTAILAGSVARGRSYYGTGECFLWRQPSNHAHVPTSSPLTSTPTTPAIPLPTSPSGTVTSPTTTSSTDIYTYKWTQANDYLMLSEPDFLALGGGDGRFSLFIDGEFYKGYSVAGPTFSNTGPICSDSKTGEFTCAAVEVWGLT